MLARDLPNMITKVRMYTAPPVIALLYLLDMKWGAIAAFAAYAFSDFLDGYLAKTYNWPSEWGRRNDPIADKALCWPMTIAIISWTGFPVTLVIPTLAYVLYDLGGEYIRRKYQRAGHNMEAPNWFARKKTLIQMGAILSMLVGLAHTGPNAETFFSFGSALYTIGVGFLAVSAYHYVMAAARVGLIRLPFMPAMF